jgi:hypothetical protein
MALALAACGDSSRIAEVDQSPASDGESEVPSLEAGSLDDFYAQEVSWSACGSNLCAQAQMPLDYADPTAGTVSVALEKHAALSEPVGTIFVNPGGPGGSGVDFVDEVAKAFRPAVLEEYDIVGFDPRGVGLSDPVDCYDTAELDEFIASDPSPDDELEAQEAVEATEDFGAACLEETGELLGHVSTI